MLAANGSAGRYRYRYSYSPITNSGFAVGVVVVPVRHNNFNLIFGYFCIMIVTLHPSTNMYSHKEHGFRLRGQPLVGL